jgi:hypothetical protein
MSHARFVRAFAAAYTVVVEPEGSDRRGASYAYGRNGRLIEEYDFESRWGTPLVLRVEPEGRSPFVGAFAAGGLGVVRDVYACPDPRHMCAIVDGLAYLVDVGAPERGAIVVANAVVQVVTVPDAPLLVLAGDADLAAVGPRGLAWSHTRLVLDDLRVLRASPEVVVCSGDVGGRMGTITITSGTGTVWGSDYR